MPKDPLGFGIPLHPMEVETIRRLQNQNFNVEQYVVRPETLGVEVEDSIEEDDED